MATRPKVVDMALFFRAIESEDGSWGCHHGRENFDRHASLEEALQHLRELARAKAPARLIAHFLDGRIEQMDVIEGSTD